MSQRKVLLIDDYPDIPSFMKAMLTQKGCQVFTTATLEEAWDICQKEHPHACCLDLHLEPHLFSAVELLRKIRAFDPTIMRVAFTRVRIFPLHQEPQEDDCHAWFYKPPLENELTELIELLATGSVTP